MRAEIHIDFEWRSAVDIKRGADLYFACPYSAPLMASYAFDADDVRRWLPHEPCPPDIRAHAEAGGRFVAHNAGNFERLAWRSVLAPRYGWPPLRTDQWRCTLAAASALGLPRSLERLGEALSLSAKKDKTGTALIRFFCIPAEWRDGAPVFREPADHPEKFALFRDYCDQDVRTEIAADRRMVPLSRDEQAAWVLDQTINDRGIRVDVRSAHAALELVRRATDLLDAEMADATGGAVRHCSEAAKLTRWIAAQDVAMEGVAKDDLLEALDLDDLPARVRRVLLIRQEAAKTSTAKLTKMIAKASADDRIRNIGVYHGTGPGRWSCLDPNLYNLPRPRKIYDDAAERGALDVDLLFQTLRTADPRLVRAMYGPELGRPTELVSDALRGFLWAAPGHELVAVDYSGIQGALCAWLAGETWKLDAMREIIADPLLPDLYRRTAAGILMTTTDVVTKKHWGRQIGKVAELALGFSGGVSALVSMARNYLIKRRQLHDLYPGVWAAADQETREKATRRYEQVRRSRRREESDVLTREAWLACSVIVRRWRATNAATAASWTELEDAVRAAVATPGAEVPALGRVTYKVARDFLWCRLPSDRCIAYAAPRLTPQVWAKLRLDDGSWGESEVVDRREAEALSLRGACEIQGPTSAKVTVAGTAGGKLVRYALYGGLVMENLCLGLEREILLNGMRTCEANGYPIVYHVYDEATAELPTGRGCAEEMAALMLRLPAWTEGLPLGAHGWSGKRYRKA